MKSATTSLQMAKSHSRNGLRNWTQTQQPRSLARRLGWSKVISHRMEQGNFSNVKSVAEAVLEYRIDFGPGYRIYFGRDGGTIIIHLTDGTKKRQQRDIETAHAAWRNYKRNRRGRVQTDRD